MANPADDLYEIFKLWRSTKLANGKNPDTKTARYLKHSKTDVVDKGWERQRQAARCLEAIAQIIDGMEKSGDNVESERQYFKEWTKAVFAYPNGWANHEAGVPDSAFNTLGLFRNSVRRFVPELEDGAVAELRRLLDNEPSLTPPEGTYPVELFDYFTRVKFHLKECIDDYDSTRTFDLQRAAENYRAAVFMMANGGFVSNPADWGRHAVATFSATKMKHFGSTVYNEGQNQLARRTIRMLEAGGQKMLEASSNLLDS